jgi:hypothetical protein
MEAYHHLLERKMRPFAPLIRIAAMTQQRIRRLASNDEERRSGLARFLKRLVETFWLAKSRFV